MRIDGAFRGSEASRWCLAGATLLVVLAGLIPDDRADASIAITRTRNLLPLLMRVQARDTDVTGKWVSQTGETFEITKSGHKVQMSFAGSTTPAPTGKISGEFDGVTFAGAYQAGQGNPPDRGVVRFFLTQDGKLEGSWQSLVNGKHGTWRLTKQ